VIALGIETSTNLCSVAVIRDGILAAERTFEHRMDLLRNLANEIGLALAGAGAALKDVGLIGCGVGPGSFTGVRVGVMTAKCLAFVRGVDAIGITTHRAAFAGLERGEGAVVMVVRAKPGFVYAGSDVAPGVGTLDEPALLAVPDLIAALDPGSGTILAGEGATIVSEYVANQGSRADFVIGAASVPRAAQAARIAIERFEQGERGSPMRLAPCYVAPPPIGLPASRPRQGPL
jgi:tRNA threonylcarbamoyladenosine biosynthesis protein TsaB